MPAVRGVEIDCAQQGSGPAFFWGHGFCSSRAQEDQLGLLRWDRLAETARVVRWDARGHGRSGCTGDAAAAHWSELARDLLGLADALGVDDFAAGGVSMGAATALHAAVLAPERVRGLVLVLPPTAWETRPAQAEQYAAGADLVETEGVAAYVERANEEIGPELLADLAIDLQFVPDVADDVLPVVLRGAAASDLPDPDEVRAITAPALVLAWIGDAGHPVSTAERLGELLGDVEVHVAHALRDVGGWTTRVQEFLAAR